MVPGRSDRSARRPSLRVPKAAPTNPASLARRSDRSWQARLDAVRILWYRRIVSFDQRTQLALVVALKETTGSLGAAVRALAGEAAASLRRWLQRPWKRARVLGWLGGAVAAAQPACCGGAAAARGGGASAGCDGASGIDPVRREAGRWLREMGERRPAQVEGGGVRADLQRLRYGPRVTWPEPQAVFRGRAGRFETGPAADCAAERRRAGRTVS